MKKNLFVYIWNKLFVNMYLTICSRIDHFEWIYSTSLICTNIN